MIIKYFIKILPFSFFIIIKLFAQNDYDITFRIVTDSLAADKQLYITGNLPELGQWDPNDIRLERKSPAIWEKTFTFTKGIEIEYKYTQGSWRTEALDSSGIEFPNFKLTVLKDSVVTTSIKYWRGSFRSRVQVSGERLKNKAGRIELFEGWRYKSGDSSLYKKSDFDDSHWENVTTTLDAEMLDTLNWTGIGWFRIHLKVDSSLWGIPLGLYLFQAGASEIYLNERKIFEYGTVSKNGKNEKAFFPDNPEIFQFDSQENQLIAVRYSNHEYDYYKRRKAISGFNIGFAEADMYISNNSNFVRYNTTFQNIFTVIPFVLALLHLLLFVYNTRIKENFFYAFFMFSFALLSYSNFQQFFLNTYKDIIYYQSLSNYAINLSLIFGLLTTYWRTYKKIPVQFYAFLMVSIVFILIFNFFPGFDFSTWFYIFLAITGFELIRIIITPFFLQKERDWFVLVGFLILILAITYQILLDLDILQPIAGNSIVYVYGILGLGIAMSVNLARDFSQTTKQLLQKERQEREQEIERRVMATELSRKTEELEQARQLQLGMLPKNIPKLPNLDIAVYMKTASEVGGDYYDFDLTNDGTLTIAIGDATGHGTKAGVMVALIKSLFNTMANTFFIPDFFSHCTKMIRKMNLGHMFMSLLIVRIRENRLNASAAGMPPIIIYRKDKEKLEEIVMKAMPLGGLTQAKYEQKNTLLNPGDTLLMLTDGLIELFNENKEEFDWERSRNTFIKNANKPLKEIISVLENSAENWRKTHPQNDDITLLIVRYKNNSNDTN